MAAAVVSAKATVVPAMGTKPTAQAPPTTAATTIENVAVGHFLVPSCTTLGAEGGTDSALQPVATPTHRAASRGTSTTPTYVTLGMTTGYAAFLKQAEARSPDGSPALASRETNGRAV